MNTVFTFSHLGIAYAVVTTASFPWRKAFGFKPKTPYMLCKADSGLAVNGVTEDNLKNWYRAKYSA